MAAKSRMPMWLGIGAAAAGGGYYLYSAGGDPKKATRKLEDDASRARSKLRGEKQSAEEMGERAGAKVDEAVDNAADRAKGVENRSSQLTKEGVEKFDEARHSTAQDIKQKIEEADKTVEQKAAEAKSGVSSWFGGKK
ncbi:hypothetical protein AJ80_03130 [Polytolypa hystricis UAMH7299]|uniref:Calcofluor white hypersensitive protein n=1 Tax=Polytolypa hystricis (strain UAMH7299) TaxID=1447883 RepID=A0A2B7YK55_POLH7|nr:hypothetical protein AJ80_03130 [Polytolypa hystricis UAMH7299]